MFHAFLYGFILCIGLIVPLGMQNIFIFNQGANQRHFSHALPSVITASFCDATLILVAVLGISLIVFEIPWLKLGIFVVGFFFLLYMSWMTWKNASVHIHTTHQPLSVKKQIAFGLSVSLLNPHAIIDSIGVIGTNALSFSGKARIAYTLGCICTSCIWFFALSLMGRVLKRLDSQGKCLTLINKISAVIILGIAGYIAYQVKQLLL